MAENPIKGEDLVDIKDIVKDFAKLESLYVDLGKTIVATAEQSKKSIQSINEVNEASITQLNNQAKAVNQLTEEQKDNAKAQEDLAKAKKKISELTEDEIKDKIKLQRELKKQRDLIKEELELADKETGTLKRIRIESNKLRKERETLNLETAEGKQRLIEINAQLDKNNEFIKENSDQLKKQKINVGNYKEEIIGALEESGAFNGVLGQLQQGFLQARSATLKMIKSLKTLKGAFAATGIGAIALALMSLFKMFTANQEGARSFEKIMARITATISVLTGVLIDLGKGIFTILQAMKDFATFDFEKGADKVSKGIDQISGSFDNLGERIEKQIEGQLAIVESQQKLKDSTRELQRAISDLSTTEQLQGQIADDTTKSFAEREKAAQAAENAASKRAALQVELAKQELDIVNQRIDLARQENQITDELLDEQLEAQLKFNDAETELLSVNIENQKRRDELRQDRLERDLDFLLDIYDNQKTINERIITDETVTFERRRALLEETRRLGQASFDDQVKIIEEFAGQKIAFDELIAESDARVVREKVRQLGLSEIVEGRALEIIRDRKTEIQDLAEAEQQLAESRRKQIGENYQSELEAIKAAADTRLKVRELELLRQGVTEEEQEKQLLKEREFLYKLQIKQLKELGEDTLDLELGLQQMRVDAERKANAKILAERKALADQIKEQSIQLVSDIADKGVELNQKAREEELQAIQEKNEEEFKELEKNKEKESRKNKESLDNERRRIQNDLEDGVISKAEADKQIEQQTKESQQRQLSLEDQTNKIRESREKEFREKEKQFKREEARANKNAEIFKATISGIRAVIEAGGLTPRGIATGIFNLAQIALLAATPLPKFKKGGSPTDGVSSWFTIGGKSHEQGGTRFWGEDGTAFEAERGEGLFVLRREAMPYFEWLNNQDEVPQYDENGIRLLNAVKRNRRVGIDGKTLIVQSELIGKAVASNINRSQYHAARYR